MLLLVEFSQCAVCIDAFGEYENEKTRLKMNEF